MERVTETHEFGPHQVVVVEHVGDDDSAYSILIDDRTVTDPPLPTAPSLEDLVRIFARTIAPRNAAGDRASAHSRPRGERTDWQRRTAGLIVVGVDGSEDSMRALRWAAGHARLLGGEVHAVTGWEEPLTIMVVPFYKTADYAKDVKALLHSSIHAALGTHPDVPVVPRLVQKHPPLALCIEAEGAELLVLGRRGRGEMPGVHLGTAAAYCVRHAPCTVVLVGRQMEHDRSAASQGMTS